MRRAMTVVGLVATAIVLLGAAAPRTDQERIEALEAQVARLDWQVRQLSEAVKTLRADQTAQQAGALDAPEVAGGPIRPLVPFPAEGLPATPTAPQEAGQTPAQRPARNDATPKSAAPVATQGTWNPEEWAAIWVPMVLYKPGERILDEFHWGPDVPSGVHFSHTWVVNRQTDGAPLYGVCETHVRTEDQPACTHAISIEAVPRAIRLHKAIDRDIARKEVDRIREMFRAEAAYWRTAEGRAYSPMLLSYLNSHGIARQVVEEIQAELYGQ